MTDFKRLAEEAEIHAMTCAEQAVYTKQCDWPEEWYQPLVNAAHFLVRMRKMFEALDETREGP